VGVSIWYLTELRTYPHIESYHWCFRTGRKMYNLSSVR